MLYQGFCGADIRGTKPLKATCVMQENGAPLSRVSAWLLLQLPLLLAVMLGVAGASRPPCEMRHCAR